MNGLVDEIQLVIDLIDQDGCDGSKLSGRKLGSLLLQDVVGAVEYAFEVEHSTQSLLLLVLPVQGSRSENLVPWPVW